MRDKEAVESERKNISRNLEKQAKAVERLVDSEKSLTAQVVSNIVSMFRQGLFLRSFLRLLWKRN